jgi:hypothetical protein
MRATSHSPSSSDSARRSRSSRCYVSRSRRVVEPIVDALAATLERALAGRIPPDDPLARAQRFDWNRVATRAETAYERALAGRW